jgi:hypothetical protein
MIDSKRNNHEGSAFLHHLWRLRNLGNSPGKESGASTQRYFSNPKIDPPECMLGFACHKKALHVIQASGMLPSMVTGLE